MRRSIAVAAVATLLCVAGPGPAAAEAPAGADDLLLELARHDAGADPFGGVLGATALLQPASQHCAPWEAVSEDVRLTEDIEDCLIRVVADDVTIDLAGFTAGLVLALADRLTIRDGAIRGAFLAFTADARLQRVTVRDSPAPFAVEAGLRTVVERSRFTGNSVGISFYYDVSASHNLVRQNHFRHNVVGAQLLAANEADGNHFAGNHFQGNAASGMYVRTLCIPSFLGPGCGGEHTLLERNRMLRNGHDPVERTWFDESGARHDDTLDDGLLVVGAAEAVAGVTVQGTVALHNADHGIEAPGVVDGGRNVAVRNGNPAQCAGVACRPGR